MPRKARLDAPGAAHHIFTRGIEKRQIFRSDSDRVDLLQRVGRLLSETETECFAWALIPNHAHFLLRTGLVQISALMRRLLTAYAVSFNKKYRRNGKLFQSRYKSILCQEDIYLKELVRYIAPQSAARRVGGGFKSAGSLSLGELGMSTVEFSLQGRPLNFLSFCNLFNADTRVVYRTVSVQKNA